VKAKGANLGVPTLPLGAPGRVQVQTAQGDCWQSTYSAGGVKRSTPEAFAAVSD
jgi:hypothetical protein